MSSLIKDYYRTVFNVFLAAPLSLHSDHSSDAASDDEKDDEIDDQLQSSSLQSSFSEDDVDGEKIMLENKQQSSTGGTSILGDLVVKPIDLKSDNVTRLAPRALPGMAARLSSTVI